MPRATFTHQAVADATIDSVWDSLQQAETWANIGPIENVADPRVSAAGLLESFRWSTTVAMKRYNGTAETVSADVGVRMKLDLDAREVAGSIETHLEPNGNGTTVITVTLEVISRGTLSTLFFPVMSDAIAKGLPTQVDQFADSLG